MLSKMLCILRGRSTWGRGGRGGKCHRGAARNCAKGRREEGPHTPARPQHTHSGEAQQDHISHHVLFGTTIVTLHTHTHIYIYIVIWNIQESPTVPCQKNKIPWQSNLETSPARNKIQSSWHGTSSCRPTFLICVHVSLDTMKIQSKFKDSDNWSSMPSWRRIFSTRN